MTMRIKELANQTGVAAETIRYYEAVGLLPAPKRAANNYREYGPADVERLRFIASARSLGLSPADVGEILAARDQGIAPCERVLTALDQSLVDLDRRLADMLALRDTLLSLRREGATLPLDDVQGEQCVCYLIKAYGETGKVLIQRQEAEHD
ncbi:MAG: heavy metal-responsive transcriptional regulator [Anaerolineales bacterium]|nr:heavy metal-responsive transcriptional regulator [Anaerolineales bacterium]